MKNYFWMVLCFGFSFGVSAQKVPIYLKNATVWTVSGKTFQKGEILFHRGRILQVGQQVVAPKEAMVIDLKGQHVTPGWIDTHSHMGAYPSPHLNSTADGNEMVKPSTPYVWVEHSIWPQDPAFSKAIEGGTTTVQILPGSGNLIGGRGVVIKLAPRLVSFNMKFPKAPHGLKMACGENPKRIHKRNIMSRMGNYAGYRREFIKAKAYKQKWDLYLKNLTNWKSKQRATSQPNKKMKKPVAPIRDLGLETLKAVLEAKILVHIHCYRANEMLWMIRLAQEFGFSIRSFHHATSAYKIADRLAKQGIAASVWSDWWGFKLEAFDAIQENAAILHSSGVKTIIHSDSSIGVQRMNIEAAKAYHRGLAMGISLRPEDALRWITMNPAWALGIDKETGSLDVGKMADLVVWDKHPLSVYARAQRVYIDGKLVFEQSKGRRLADFELGLNSLKKEVQK